MFQHLNNRLGHYSLLLLVGAATFLANLGSSSLWDLDEGRNATAALEMMEAENWILPTFNGELRVDKPALLYWLQIAAYRTFGVSEFAARLPSALAALLTLLLTYELGRQMFNAFTGLLGGLILASSMMLCAAARFANPDALLNLCTVLTLFLFWWRLSRTGKFPHVLTSVACGLGVLAKGPVGLVLPLAVIFLYLLWNRQVRVFWKPGLLLGAAAFCLVALPWYALVSVETKFEFLKRFLMGHNVDRFLSPMERHSGGPYYYLVVLLVGFAPWSAFLFLSVWYGFWSAFRKPWKFAQKWWETTRDDESHDLDAVRRYRLLWCWVAVYLVFFSVAATKLPNYVLPVTAPIALLTARALDRWRRGLIQPSVWMVRACLLTFALIGPLTTVGMLVAAGVIPLPLRGFAPLPGLEAWAFVGLAPLLGAAAALWYQRRGRPSAAVASLTVATLLFIGPLAVWAAQALDQAKAPRPLVAQTGSFNRAEEIQIGCYNLGHLPSLNFYCQRCITHFQNPTDVQQFLKRQASVYLYISYSDWVSMRDLMGQSWRLVGRHRDLYRSGEVVVVTNKPAE